jgi:hypothetical protein
LISSICGSGWLADAARLRVLTVCVVRRGVASRVRGSGAQPTLPSRLMLEQLLRLDGELHRQLVEDLLAEAVDDHGHGVFLGCRAAGSRRAGRR